LIVASIVILLLGAGGAGAGIALTHGGAAFRTLRDSASRTSERHAKAALRPSPLPGALLIADRGNNRILLVTARHRWLWRFPDPADRSRGVILRFDDDAFVAPGGRTIVSNEEDADTIVSIDIATHGRVHLYGEPGVKGSSSGLLNTPDDAYPLPGGVVTVADAYNCRVLWIRAHRIIRQLGQTGVCQHDPPKTFGSLNGDTPLPGGGVLVSEISGSWIDAIAANGRLLYSFRAPVRYPSDPQPLPGGRILIADYSKPGAVVIVNHDGTTLWRYRPISGFGELDHPSLAIMLPNGDIAVNDDFRDRVVVIDPRTSRIVWIYGHTGHPGTKPGYLHLPDGMDFVPLNAHGRPQWTRVHHA
jgi:PQQ-like domain